MNRRLSWRSYTRSFLRPIRVKSQVLTERQGLWLILDRKGGQQAVAECAPLPAWHPESLAQTIEALARLQRWFEHEPRRWDQWCWTEPFFGVLSGGPSVFSSLQTALDMLLLGEARYERPELFDRASPQQVPRSAALINDLGNLDLQELAELWQRGVRVFKVKLGRHSMEIEQKALEAMRGLCGEDLRLRLDLNQATLGRFAEVWLEWLRTWPIDYIEDPGTMQPRLPFPVAYDEDLSAWESRQEPSGILVLKPNCLGLSQTIRWLLSGHQAVLSNTYESRLSLQAYLWVYSRFVREPQAIGFGTVRALPADFVGSVIDEYGVIQQWPPTPFLQGTVWPSND